MKTKPGQMREWFTLSGWRSSGLAYVFMKHSYRITHHGVVHIRLPSRGCKVPENIDILAFVANKRRHKNITFEDSNPVRHVET